MQFAVALVILMFCGSAVAGSVCIVDKKGQRTCTEQSAPGTATKDARPKMRFIIKDIPAKPPAKTPSLPAPPAQ